jgi:hypothetical protein
MIFNIGWILGFIHVTHSILVTRHAIGVGIGIVIVVYIEWNGISNVTITPVP